MCTAGRQLLLLEASWLELRQSLVPAILGAAIALILSAIGKALLAKLARRRRRKRSTETAARFPPVCEAVGCGLEEFAREVEGRLDAKLDRLEQLLRHADLVPPAEDARMAHVKMHVGAGEGLEASRRPVPGLEARRAGIPSHPGPEGEVRPISTDERQSVLALAAGGKSPEAISEALGLLRGEVDLILRLYGRESPAKN